MKIDKRPIKNFSREKSSLCSVNQTLIIDPQRSAALRIEDALAQWHHPRHFRAFGFYVQDERYAAGAGSAGAALSRLGALVPKPRVNLTRFHAVFAPNSKYRAQVTPAKQGNVKKPRPLDEDQTPAECKTAMTWAQRRYG